MPRALTQDTAVDAAEFARLCDAFTPSSPKIALAVSGGADSMALALCAHQWRPGSCITFIVDHKLREESSTEAFAVKARLEKIGLQAEILIWDHEPLTSRIEAQARDARYRLLIDACHRHEIADLLTAHHADDQAETVLLRLSKGSGVDGLAGIAAVSRREDVRLLRPFLSLPKERLIATCKAADVAFVTDPTNASDKFARARLRKITPLLAEEGLSVANLNNLAAHARDVKEALDFYTRALLEKNAICDIGGSVRLDRTALRLVPRAIASRALASCLRYVHEESYAPERTSLATLLSEILSDAPELTRTFYGCLISVTQDRALILREPSAVTDKKVVRPGTEILWDGRWLVKADKEDIQGEIRALGAAGHEAIDLLAPELRRRITQGRVRASLPALWQGDRLVAIPSFDKKAPFRLSYKKAQLL